MLLKKFEELCSSLTHGSVVSEQVDSVGPFETEDELVEAANQIAGEFKMDEEDKTSPELKTFTARVKATGSDIVKKAADKLFDQASAENSADKKADLKSAYTYVIAISKDE